MRVNVYFSGISPTGSPWSWDAVADNVAANRNAEQHVRTVSGGAYPVCRVTIDVPDEVMAKLPVMVGDDVVAEAIDDLSVAA